MCYYCGGNKPIEQIKECLGCSCVLYCSRECQVAHYPRHKDYCKCIQEMLKDEISTAESVD
jgi:hypothetical protein